MALTPPIWRQVWVRVCAYVCVYPPFQIFPAFPTLPAFTGPPRCRCPLVSHFTKMLKYQIHWNCVENVWQFINARRLTCINILQGSRKMGLEKRTAKWVEIERGWGVESWSMCGEHLKNFPKCEKSNKRPRLRCLFTVFSFPSRIAEHFPLFMVAILFREPSKSFPLVFFYF